MLYPPNHLSVRPSVHLQKCVFPPYLQNKWMNFDEILYICSDIYKINVVSNAHYFWSIFNRVMALDQRQHFVYAQYLVNYSWNLIKLCICIDIDKM